MKLIPIFVTLIIPIWACDLKPRTAVKWYQNSYESLDNIKQILLNYNDVDWMEISTMGLSEQFIDTFSKKVNWEKISYHQNLTDEFMNKYKDKIDWYWVLELNKHVPNDLKNELNSYFAHRHGEYLSGRYNLTI